MSLTPITGGVTLKERRPIPGSLTVLATGPTNYEKNGTLTSYKQGPIQTERFEAKNKSEYDIGRFEDSLPTIYQTAKRRPRRQESAGLVLGLRFCFILSAIKT